MIALVPHAPAAAAVTVAPTRSPGVLTLRTRIAAAGLVLPPRDRFRPVDGLWRTTCAEAFIADPQGEGYAEYNLSPSGAYAAYRFARHRARSGDAPPPLSLTVAIEADAVTVTARLPCPDGPLRMGLTAVVEAAGTIHYFALRHPPGPADFHAAEGWLAFP